MNAPPPDASWNDPDRLASAIGRFAPFKSWPLPARLRLARAGKASSHPPGALLIEYDRPEQALTFVLEGATQASITDPGGRRVTFRYDASTMVFGLAPMVDGKPSINELLAQDRVKILRVPFTAVMAELSAAPALWESIGVELCERFRHTAQQMTRFVFDEPRVHMAALLVGLAGKAAQGRDAGPVTIDMRLSQELLAEMLAISRQWAAQLIQEMVKDGLVQWRYGRATLLNIQRLRAIAGGSISGG